MAVKLWNCERINEARKVSAVRNDHRVHYNTPQKVEIDIHHMTSDMAKRHLELYLSRADGSVKEVAVIHGYSGGTVLRDMVRGSLRHPRIRAKYASVNPGVTILVLT